MATNKRTVAVMVKCGDTFVRFSKAPEGYAVLHGHVECPRCGRRGGEHTRGGFAVSGTHNPDKVCSARCRNARRGDCECECGGEHHGVDQAGAFG